MVAWNIWKVSFRQGSPDPLEASTTQREASSIYWLFQDNTLPVLVDGTYQKFIFKIRGTFHLGDG